VGAVPGGAVASYPGAVSRRASDATAFVSSGREGCASIAWRYRRRRISTEATQEHWAVTSCAASIICTGDNEGANYAMTLTVTCTKVCGAVYGQSG